MHYRVSVEVQDKDLCFKVNDNLDVLDRDKFIKENVENFLESVDKTLYENIYIELDGERALLS